MRIDNTALNERLHKVQRELLQHYVSIYYSDWYKPDTVVISDVLDFIKEYKSLSHDKAKDLFLSQKLTCANPFEVYETNIKAPFDNNPKDGELVLLMFKGEIIGGGCFDEETSMLYGGIYFYIDTIFTLTENIDKEVIDECFFYDSAVCQGSCQ